MPIFTESEPYLGTQIIVNLISKIRFLESQLNSLSNDFSQGSIDEADGLCELFADAEGESLSLRNLVTQDGEDAWKMLHEFIFTFYREFPGLMLNVSDLADMLGCPCEKVEELFENELKRAESFKDLEKNKK